ncbi:peptidyl-tRNA hydrolase [Galactobacter caseinivorans]|uniref:peptidyl-tRNA hydrolase n=1 Tax=Galactobacter caseinivorans TaxID=2676123 RepID=A0A496PJC5_9MICC|nr:peptidyl-tRNA hydrolase [Galactobacter caseinivorans]RKW70603.1 hypothetical protein DWQ67_05625 [Galactobacter caseinivorans]
MPAVDMIQPIGVLNDPEHPASHEDTCLAAALASVKAWIAFPEDPMWEQWYPDGQGKSVRRGKPKDFRALETQGAVMVRVGDALAAGLPPAMYPLSGRMKQLQVAGTEMEHSGRPASHEWPAPEGVPSLQIGVDTALGMSTGKAAAQSAHAAFDWAVRQGPERLRAWAEAGCPARLVPLHRADMARLAPAASVRIHDAGHTEIASGSLTAIAR